MNHTQWIKNWEHCTRCRLHLNCNKRSAIGFGSTEAQVCIVGVEPGEDDRIFSGSASRYFFNAVRFGTERAPFFYTALLACRRDPDHADMPPPPEAVFACLPRLIQLIENLPKVRLVVYTSTLAAFHLRSRFDDDIVQMTVTDLDDFEHVNEETFKRQMRAVGYRIADHWERAKSEAVTCD